GRSEHIRVHLPYDKYAGNHQQRYSRQKTEKEPKTGYHQVTVPIMVQRKRRYGYNDGKPNIKKQGLINFHEDLSETMYFEIIRRHSLSRKSSISNLISHSP